MVLAIFHSIGYFIEQYLHKQTYYILFCMYVTFFKIFCLYTFLFEICIVESAMRKDGGNKDQMMGKTY